jgi:tetratricopeptide (TPR) repeat protein
LADAIRAWEKAARVSRSPWEPLQSLGYADLLARRPQQALAAFDDAARSLPEHSELIVDNTFLANIAHGRARSWYRLGNLPRAISYEEDAARLLPASADLWRQLAGLYAAAGRNEDAHRALAQASAIP